MLDWRIYYWDETTCDSSQVECYEDAPLDGVLFVLDANRRTGRRVLHGCDYYPRPPSKVWLERQKALDVEPFIARTDNLGPFLRVFCPFIKWGLWAGDGLVEHIRILADNDPDFPNTGAVDSILDYPKAP